MAGGWKTVGVLAALVLAGARGAPGEEPDFVRVRVDTANVRKAPTTDAAAVSLAYEDDPLRVVATRRGWLKVRDFQGEEGWIYGPLTDQRPAVIVTAPVANLRSGPGATHPVTHTAERGVSFRAIGRRGAWIRVEHADGTRAWIHRSLVWGEVPPGGD